ncbi:hypothetical protein F53441_9029 [Fusarium austroafricanum]|uniref:Uncharacterized protein n=1 Tax=Fusarium austroafricanum TaxID=2364996 RepID=A0A8H4KDN7_9HYPO|nr:hypothetical protein F53441_9029 [Fusarium austroafricanum]
MSTENSIFKTAVYGLWSFQLGCLTIPHLFVRWVMIIPLFIPLTLEMFLLFTTASRISIMAPWTKRFNRFFYETRDWAMILPIMSILWLFGLFLVVAGTFMDLIAHSGPTDATLNFIAKHLGAAVFYVIYLGGIISYISLLFWVLVGGFQACMRVKNLRSPEEEEAMTLTAKDDDEWNDFQDNRRN